ncbi:MAG: PD40 domain-containing protein, partial [Acidimicrobiia bacterium]|nr:PD40 domain-containing protein [Acidimicrobiia bacterium]
MITVLTSVLGVITTTLLDVKPATAAPSTARVSTTSSAGQASGWQAAISADGNWVAFVSNSTALSTNPSGYNQVYRKNLSTGAVDLVSVNTSGAVGTGNSASPAISKDGRYVAFDSDAADLVAGDTNGYRDVFIRDFGVTPAATSLVSAPASGGSAAGASYSPSVSGDGNRVAFESNASLNPDDANCGAADVYLRDRAAATTTRVSKIVGWSPASANQCGSQYISTFEDAHVGRQAISADGRYVVFRGHWSGSPLHNGACDYASSEVNQPFAYDSLTGKTPAVGGEWAMGCDGALPAISPDGSIVAYADHSWTGFYVASPAGTATIGGYTGGDPAYHVNVLPGGTAPNASISDPVLSNTGARIAFSSTASNIAAGDTNGREDVFYLDWGPTASAQVSLTSAGADPQSFSSSAPAGSTAPSIASDGTAIAYGSVASDLVSGDTNGLSDVFTRTGLSTPAPASLTVAMLLGGGNNPAIKCLLCQAVEHNFGRPVDAATGNFWHSFDDLSIPGRGMPLDFTRTYNSAASTAKGPLGYGWTEPYNMSITNPDGSAIAGSPSAVVVNQENAAQVPFNGTGGAYQPPSFVQASLVHNADSTWTFTRNAKEVFTFSPTGALTSEKTLNPEVTTVSAVANNTQTIADSGGRTFTLAYWPTGSGSGKDNLIHTVTDSGGRVVTFDYADNNSNLTDVTDVGGGHSQFAYDGSHHVVEMRSANFASDGAMPTPPSSCSPSTGPAHVTANVYDAQGRVICQYDPDGNKTSFDYSTPGTTKVTDPRGNVTTQTFSNYLLTSEIKGTGTPQQATWTYTTNPLTLGVASVTDPNGAVQTYNYDNFGNVVGSTDGLGRRTLKTYDSLNDLTSVTDPKGVLTTMAYDADGNLVSRSTPLDGHTCPDPPGPPTYCQVYTYSRTDSAHPDDVITYSDPSSTGSGNRAWTYNYDPGSGNLLSEQDSLGNKTMYCYDSIGRRFETMAPAGSSGFSCPASTPPTPGAHGTVFLYNNFGDVTKTTDSLSHSTTSTFDADRNLLSTTDAKGNVTSYGYDPAGQRTSQTAADATTTTYGYDPAGNRTSVGAPGAPAVSDGFNRAGGTLGTADTGQGWQNIYGSPAVMTNKFGPSTVANAAAYVNAGTGMANASVRATTTLSTTGGSSFPYLILRVVNTNTWLYVYLNTSTSKVSLWKDQGGVFSAVDPTDHPYAPTFAAGGTYTVAATMNGANISVAINGAALFSYALSSADQTTFDAATSDGLGMNVANTTQQQVRWDDFSISPLTSTTDAFDPLNRMSGETDQLGRTTAYSYDGAGNRLTKQDPGGNCSTTPKTGCTTSTYDAANELKTVTYSDGTTPNVSSISYDADGQRTDMTDGA